MCIKDKNIKILIQNTPFRTVLLLWSWPWISSLKYSKWFPFHTAFYGRIIIWILHHKRKAWNKLHKQEFFHTGYWFSIWQHCRVTNFTDYKVEVTVFIKLFRLLKCAKGFKNQCCLWKVALDQSLKFYAPKTLIRIWKANHRVG